MIGQVYVISLETSHDRRAAFDAYARASGVTMPWSYFTACTGLTPELSYSPRNAVIARGRPLYAPELGVYSSHYSVWRHFLSSGADQVLILEDDVIVDWHFIEDLMSTNLSDFGILYLKLFNKNITPFRTVSTRFLNRTLIDCRGFAHGMQAYMLTRTGAEKFSVWCRSVRRPIDDELDRSWAHGVPNLAVFPFPAFERHVPSTIGSLRYDRHSVPTVLQPSRIMMRTAERGRRLMQTFGGFGHQKATLPGKRR